MGFPKAKANIILTDAFKVGNTIQLLTSIDTDAESYIKMSGAGCEPYVIKDGDFKAVDATIINQKNLLLFLAEADLGIATGFAVFNGGTLQYFGELVEAKTVSLNTVPVFKRQATGEGIKVTLDVVSVAAVDVQEST